MKQKETNDKFEENQFLIRDEYIKQRNRNFIGKNPESIHDQHDQRNSGKESRDEHEFHKNTHAQNLEDFNAQKADFKKML